MCLFLCFMQSIKFTKVTNTVISGFTSLNPPAFHMHVVQSTNFTAHSLTITAPDESPNTDGMHISTSCNVKVLNSKIGTGDDCISVGQGNTDVTISGIQCGPGHGIRYLIKLSHIFNNIEDPK